MKDLPFTQADLLEAFEYKDGFLYWREGNRFIKHKIGGKQVNSANTKHSPTITFMKRTYAAHRIIFMYYHGYMPRMIDHADRNKLNNNIDNLRECTASQNNSNKLGKAIGKCASDYKGVVKYGNRWLATIGKDGGRKHIGSFSTEVDAALAYNRSAVKKHGEFAYLNIIKP